LSQTGLAQAVTAAKYRVDDHLTGPRTAILFGAFFILKEAEEAAVR